MSNMVSALREELQAVYREISNLRTNSAARIAALEAEADALREENDRLRKALENIASEAKVANDVIRMNRDGGGNGRVKVATAMHRIEHGARAALEAKP